MVKQTKKKKGYNCILYSLSVSARFDCYHYTYITRFAAYYGAWKMFFDLLINAFLLLLITILTFIRAKWEGIGTCYGYRSNLLVSCHYTSCSHGTFFSITNRFLSFLCPIILRIDSNLMNVYTNFCLALTFNCFSIFSIFLLHLRILYGEEEKIRWLPLVSFDDQFLVRIFKRGSKKKKK